MPPTQTFVIVGASLAGAKAAETLRVEGFDGRVVLIGEEPLRPYERPPLSKAYLRGEVGFDEAAVHQTDFYASNDIELRTSTTVTALVPKDSQVTLGSSERLSYDRLLVATGASPRRLSVPGAELDGVRYLRSVADADALQQAIETSAPVVVIGGGWIGCEVAASARQLGAEVAMVEMAPVPLGRVLGSELGTVYRDLHAEHGVKLHFGVGVDSVRGSSAVEEVRLTDGTSLPAGVVVVGVGVVPRVQLAEAAGLKVDDGVVVDEQLATSQADIYAAGDVANAFHPFYRTQSASSTGRPPSTRGPWRPRTCSASAPSTKRCRTSSPTSTTSEWSTRASRRNGTKSCSAGIPPRVSSSHSGCTMVESWQA